MPGFRHKLLPLLAFVLLPALARAEPPTSPQQVQAEYRAFIKMGERVSRQEPELVSNPSFDQKFTLKYQRYGGSQEVTAFKLVFVVPANAVKLEQLAKTYVKYAKEASGLSEDLPVFVKNHISMITDAAYARKYQAKYHDVLGSLFPGADGALKEFQVFDCDYVTQPTDALWYTVHASRLLDRYGQTIFGKEWEEKRKALEAEHKIKSIEEMRALVEPLAAPSGQARSRSAPAENPAAAGSAH